jgi:hypothetical protein
VVELPGGGAVAGTSCADAAADVNRKMAAAKTNERMTVPPKGVRLATVRATKKPEATLPAYPFSKTGEA